jgi:hypothetical protein
MKILCTLLIGFLPAVMGQQAPMAVPVEMSIPFGTVMGQLVLHPGYMVFVDSEQAAGSFAVTRDGIASFNVSGDVAQMATNANFRDRSGERNRLSFRITTSDGIATLDRWYKMTPPASKGVAGAPAAAEAKSAESLTFDATHKRFMRGDNRGKLIITDTKLIYESVGDAERSRQWEYKDIKELKRGNPYNLKVVPFVGDDYDFQLNGQPMDNSQFKSLVDRVTSARTGTR